MIRDNLQFNDQLGAWKTSNLLIADPGTLPDSYPAALASLARTKRTLSNDEAWAIQCIMTRLWIWSSVQLLGNSVSMKCRVCQVLIFISAIKQLTIPSLRPHQ